MVIFITGWAWLCLRWWTCNARCGARFSGVYPQLPRAQESDPVGDRGGNFHRVSGDIIWVSNEKSRHIDALNRVFLQYPRRIDRAGKSPSA